MRVTKNSRANVLLEKPLYLAIKHIAKRNGVSMSLKVRDLVKEALKIEEDSALSALAKSREKTFKRATALKHTKVW